MEQIRLIIDDLVKKGVVSKEQLEKAQEESKKKGMALDKILIREGIVKEENIV